MITKKPKASKIPQKVGIGKVVIAMPHAWPPGPYRRSVILIISHDMYGSKGFILSGNNESEYCDNVENPRVKFPIFQSGPYRRDEILFLHNDSSIEGADYLGNEIFLSAGDEADNFYERALQGDFAGKSVSVMQGMVKWKPRQLAKEIRKFRWLISDITAQELFRLIPEDLWVYKMAEAGYRSAELFPPHCDLSEN